MALEVEVKLRVEDHDAVRQRLIAAGASLLGEVQEINRIFDDAARQLLAGNRGLRIRACLSSGGRLVSASWTYKGPPRSSAVKCREEIETGIEDPDAAARILIALGFIEVMRFEKRRQSWSLERCTVELDELPYLGRFVEIEGPDEGTVAEVRRRLALDTIPHVPGSYVALLADYCRRNDIPTTSITFTST